MIGWLARYEVRINWVGMEPGVFRFTSLRDVHWAFRFVQAPDFVAAEVKITARDRWTGRAIERRSS